MTSPYIKDQKITDVIKSKNFAISAEVIPPRNGTPQEKILRELSLLIEAGVHFLSVTKGAGGSLRGGSLPIAQMIKDHFKVPCIAHFTCRDLTPQEIENNLIDHHFFGIRNILGLRGDPPSGESEWSARPGCYNHAYELINQIKALNSGNYFERKGFNTANTAATDFCIGAAAYPDDTNPNTRIPYFMSKFQAGAEFGITQMIYSPDSYSRFIDDLAKQGCTIPILPGARVLKSKAQAQKMAGRFGIPIPQDFIDLLPDDESETERAKDLFLQLVEKFKMAGAPGLHVFVLTDSVLASEIIKVLK